MHPQLLHWSLRFSYVCHKVIVSQDRYVRRAIKLLQHFLYVRKILFISQIYSRVGILSPAMWRGIDSRNRVWNWVVKLHRLAGRYDNLMPTWFLAPIAGLKLPTQFLMLQAVEVLYCKSPIQCLASSELLTHPPRVFTPTFPPAFGAGGGHAGWVERGWKVNSSEDARHCSVSVTLSPAMGARNQVGIGLSYRPASLYVAWLLNSRLGSWNQFLVP